MSMQNYIDHSILLGEHFLDINIFVLCHLILIKDLRTVIGNGCILEAMPSLVAKHLVGVVIVSNN